MSILNFTQHAATAEQVAAGVIDLMQHDLASLKELLNFVGLPTADEIYERAYAIAALAENLFAETGHGWRCAFPYACITKSITNARHYCFIRF